MKFDDNAWFTIYDPEYNNGQYIYHYTNFDTALKILFSKGLKFSRVCNTNDALESKPKLGLDSSFGSSDINKIQNYISSINSSPLQLLCFTKDFESEIKGYLVKDRQMFGDYTGRGFSSPMMWSQYANDNGGVCFVFKKKKIETIIKKALNSDLILNDSIKYVSRFDTYPLPTKKTHELLNKINNADGNISNIIFSNDFLRKNIEFVKYCYFSKLDDWIGENEYRFLALGDAEYSIPNIDAALSGVIVGGKISPEDLEIMSYFCYDLCELKQIIFTYNGCNLVNVHDN